MSEPRPHRGIRSGSPSPTRNTSNPARLAWKCSEDSNVWPAARTRPSRNFHDRRQTGATESPLGHCQPGTNRASLGRPPGHRRFFSKGYEFAAHFFESGRILSGPFGCSKWVASFRERISPVVASLCCRLRGSRCHEVPGILATTDNVARDGGNPTEGALMTGTHSSAATAFCGMRCGQRSVLMPPRVKAPGRSPSIAPFAAYPISTNRAVLTAGG